MQTQVDVFSNNTSANKDAALVQQQQQFVLNHHFVASFLLKWANLKWEKAFLDKVGGL